MSPRRRIEPGEPPLLVAQPVARPRRWRLPVMFGVAGLVIAEAITACTLILISHEAQRRETMKTVAVLGEVRGFMADFTSLDPFNANDYIDRILAQATGDFAKQYQEKANIMLLAVAKGDRPTTGTILDAGVERWNDDGSANVLVATQITARAPEGRPETPNKDAVDTAYRWLVTAQQEGDQWKISSLVQVM